MTTIGKKATRENKNPLKLIEHHETEIKRFVKVKGDKSPYDNDQIYWSSRLGKHPPNANRYNHTVEEAER